MKYIVTRTTTEAIEVEIDQETSPHGWAIDRALDYGNEYLWSRPTVIYTVRELP